MLLSKTNYLIYRECKKNAWIKIHRPEIYNQYPLSSFEQNIIDTGNEIDILARALFSGGVLVEDRDDTELTQELIAQKTPVIYQPLFTTDRYITACDILVWNKDRYDLYEVKASSGSDTGASRKDKDYVVDVAFQRVVLEACGVPLGNTFLIRLNKDYVRKGEIDLQNLFLIEDFTEQVEEGVSSIQEEMEKASDFLSKNKEPEGYCECMFRSKGGHCTTSPYSLADLPEYPVHAISRIHKTKLGKLVDQGVLDIQKIPADFELSDRQRSQVDVAQAGEPFIDREGIDAFLSDIEYPISFLDYETYPSALPRYDGYKPYQQIPFQFSVHIKESKESDLVHHEFIYTDKECPDLPFAEALEKYLPEKGSIIVWNKSFESGVNKKLGERLPQHASFLEDIDKRMVDLMLPFSGKTMVYDHPLFRGSSSIKYVLPALVPELSYKELDIQEGGSASDTWNRIVSHEYTDEEKTKKINDLLAYCTLDTLAMVRIWEELGTSLLA